MWEESGHFGPPQDDPAPATDANAVCDYAGISGKPATFIEAQLAQVVLCSAQDAGVLMSSENAAHQTVDLIAFKSKQVAAAVREMH